MDIKKIWNKINKPVITVAVIVLTALLFVLLLSQTKASPENPMEKEEADASKMYLISSILAMDESLTEDIENANIRFGGDKAKETDTEETAVEQTKEKEPEEQKEQQKEESEQLQKEEQTTDEDPTDDSMDSLLSLIQKNEEQNPTKEPDPNGEPNEEGPEINDDEGLLIENGSGQSGILSPEDSNQLFTTSIVDGDRRTSPIYSFTITLTAKGRAQTLISQIVTVNGMSQNYQNGDSIQLKEGANTIVVTLRFRDKNYNQIDAPTKVYTVYYIPEHSYYLQVQDADTGVYYTDGENQNVTEPVLNLIVFAMKGDRDTSARLRLNNTSITSDEDGIYRMTLKVGINTIKVTAGTGVDQQTITFSLNYQPGVFTLTMESDAVTEKIQGDQFGRSTYAEYASESEAFAFRISCSKTSGAEQIQSILVTTHLGTTEMVHMAGANGYINCSLDATQITEIKVTCSDIEGAKKQYTWQIKYVRTGTTPEAKKPIIQANLADGEVLKSSPYILTVHSKDYLGKQLYASQMQVYLNGQIVEYSSMSGIAYEYILYPNEGENLIQIVASDTEQYRAVKEIPFFYEAVVENVNVTLIVDANVVNLGTFVQENLTVPSNTTIAQFLEERLIANGYTPGHLGSVTGEYYLQSIAKPGILNNWYVSEERQNQLIAEGYGFTQPQNMNILSEYEFTQGSGWMITLNGYFIGMGMGTRPVRDGDVVRVQFTLDLGTDIGVDPNGGING